MQKLWCLSFWTIYISKLIFFVSFWTVCFVTMWIELNKIFSTKFWKQNIRYKFFETYETLALQKNMVVIDAFTWAILRKSSCLFNRYLGSLWQSLAQNMNNTIIKWIFWRFNVELTNKCNLSSVSFFVIFLAKWFLLLVNVTGIVLKLISGVIFSFFER